MGLQRHKGVIWLILALLLLLPVIASGTVFISKIVSAEPPSDCPSGTYEFAWNGDHSSGTLWACTDSGASTTEATGSGTYTISSSYGEDSTNGIGFTSGGNGDDFIKWTNITDVFGSAGTIWLSVYPVDGASAKSWFEAVYSGAYYSHGGALASERVWLYYKATNSIQIGVPQATVTLSAWNRIAYTWSVGGDVGAVTDDGSSWYTDTATFDTWPGSGYFTIGWDLYGGSSSDVYYVDNVYIVTGYQASDPMP